jgi:hypothetical protein
MKKRSTKTTSSVNKKLAIAITVIVAVVGWAVYQTSRQDHIAATDSTGRFSFEYPESWVIKPYVWEDCCGAETEVEPDWSKDSKPITLHPVDDPEATVSISMTNYENFMGSFEKLRDSVEEDNFAQILFDGTRDDGHRALFSRVDYLGPPDAKVETFIDHRYYFDNGTMVLSAEFREKYHHDWPDEETGPDIDNSAYLADYEQIANSVTFSK